MGNIPFPESAPDIITVAFKEIDRLPPAQKAEALARLHGGVIHRAVEMIPVPYEEETADESVRALSLGIAKGGNRVASAEIHRPKY